MRRDITHRIVDIGKLIEQERKPSTQEYYINVLRQLEKQLTLI